MQILYVFCLLAFALHSLNAMNSSSDQRLKAQLISNRFQSNVELQNDLGILARKAYDQGRKDVGCPANTVRLDRVGTASVPLCWSTRLLNGRCFNDIRFKGRSVCFANNQNFQASQGAGAWPSVASLALGETARAYSLREPSSYGNFSGGFVVTNPVPNASGGDQARAYVTLPPAEAGLSVRGNHIDCRKAHTDCFTIVYCLNGLPSCTAENRFIATYATRQF